MLALLLALVPMAPAQTWNGEFYEWEMPIQWRIVGTDPSLPGDPEAIFQEAWALWSQEPCGGLSHEYLGWEPDGSTLALANEVVLVLGDPLDEVEESGLLVSACDEEQDSDGTTLPLGCRLVFGDEVDWLTLEPQCTDGQLFRAVILHDLAHLVAAPNPCAEGCDDPDARYSVSGGLGGDCSLAGPTAYDLALVAEAHGIAAHIAGSSGDVIVDVGEERCFSADVLGAATTLEWDFGDGNTATGPEACHTWAEDGVYTLTLRYGDAEDACVGEDVGRVRVGSAGITPAGEQPAEGAGCGCGGVPVGPGGALLMLGGLGVLGRRRQA